MNGAPQTDSGEPHPWMPADAGASPLGSDDCPTFIGKIPESQPSIRPFANVPLLIAGYQKPFTLQATEPGYFQHLTLRSAIYPLLLIYFNDGGIEKVPGEWAKRGHSAFPGLRRKWLWQNGKAECPLFALRL